MKPNSAAATIVAPLLLLTLTLLAAGQEQAAEDDSQAQPVSEPPIKLVHVLNPGEREYLSPNLIGVQNIAMTFLPLTMNFVNIIDAFREIVNGVQYEIHLNAVDTQQKDAEIICRLVILEKPWLTTQWGDKVRELVNSNCTSDADNLTDPLARSNALNDKYQSNAFFNGGARNELADDEMSQLESQIIQGATSKRDTTTTTTSTSTSTSTTSTTSSTTTTTEQTSDNVNTERPRQDNEVVTAAANDDTPAGAVNGGDGDGSDEQSTQLPELSDDEKKWLDDIFSVGAYNFESTRQEQKQKNAAKNVNAERRGATAVGGDDGASNYVPQNDDETTRPLEQSEHTNDYQQQQQQQQQQEQQQQQTGETQHERRRRDAPVIVGGPISLDTNEAEERLQNSLEKLAAGDGPQYKISTIHSATTQVVAGTLTKINADLIDDQGENSRCDIDIWSRPWLPNGIEVTIACDDKEPIKRRHSRSVEYAEKKTHKKQHHFNLEKTEHLFNKFQAKFNRRYHSTMERQMRMRIFKQNLRTIEELNRNEMGSAKYGITEFADMTSSEYKSRTGLWQRGTAAERTNTPATIPDVKLPKEFDWRQKGAVSHVKNQGTCGSCWAFSVTGNIEGLHAVKTGSLEEYSEQELLDCDTEDSACNGGLPDNAYDAILKIGGLELESEYPYKGRKEQCRFDKKKVHVKVTGAVDLPKNETAIAQWLITNGPISIGINANAMQFYRGGVSHPWHALCSKKNLDHGVLIVGYGVSEYPNFNKTLPYWIIKNSWGPKWGEQGYYRVYRGDNTCGVSEMASSAVLGN